MVDRGEPLRSVAVGADPELREHLREAGLAVRAVDDQAEALAALDDEAVHCVVAALAAGDPDAVGLCAAVRERDADLPFLVVTGAGLGDRAEAAVEADVSGLGSPDEPAAVAERARTAAAAYREEAERRRSLEADARILDDLLSNLPLSIYVKDELHRHRRVSDAMICAEDPDLYLENDEGKAHQHPDDLLGKTDYDIFGPSAESSVRDDETVMETGDPIVDKIEQTHTRLGDEVYFSTSKAPRYDEDGEPAGVLGVTIDVTDRIRYRKNLEQQNERLEEFASMVSHDLRNPLSVVQGYLEVLEEGYDEAAVEHSVEAAERMDELIEEILAYARQGRAVVDPDVVDLESVARRAWNSVDTGDATLAVETELPVRADCARLQRALENCFRNAVEHGGADVAVRVADDGTDFYVEDDGPGIEPELRETVFERGVTGRVDGTGFGLAAVATIADAHGWDVAVEDGSDGGARVVFTGVARSDAH